MYQGTSGGHHEQGGGYRQRNFSGNTYNGGANHHRDSDYADNVAPKMLMDPKRNKRQVQRRTVDINNPLIQWLKVPCFIFAVQRHQTWS